MTAATEPVTSRETLERLLAESRQSWLAAPPDLRQRREDLRALKSAVKARRDELVAAMDADFGHRSEPDSVLGDLLLIDEEIDHTLAHLRAWTRRRPVPVNWKFQPASAWVEYHPLGVVGIISPWNYPVNLALIPLISALAAGNHALLKPAEHTPQTGAALQALVEACFPRRRVAVVQGGAEVAASFSALPFDHLFFTGSTAVGRQVMAAAADNLTPVTLELGGKSPAVLDPDYAPRRAAESLVAGKLLNAGQTCIAPDYVLLPGGGARGFAEHLRTAAAELYPNLRDNPDYTSIVNAAHYQRLQDLLASAARGGVELVPLFDTPHDAARRRLTPTVAVNPPPESGLMREEIFGPILPLVEVDDLDAAIRLIRAGPRPLALYPFSDDPAFQRRLLEQLRAGGVCINDTLLHIAQSALPFGGIGGSGMGRYHGWYGFETFSQALPVFKQSRFSGAALLRPPYTVLKRRLLRWLS